MAWYSGGSGIVEGLLNPFSESSKTTNKAASLLTPQQLANLNKLMPMLMGNIENPYNQETQDYYKNVIEQPSIKQYEEQTRPAWMEKLGSLHSSTRANMEQKGYEDLYSGLASQKSDLIYKNKQNSINELLAALGLQTKENIVDKPGMFESLMGGLPNVGTGGLASFFR